MLADESQIVLETQDGQSWTVGPTPITIGRGTGNTIQVPDPRVSRQHATVWAGGGRLWIRDQNSTHGVRVRGQRVIGQQEIRPGDTIQVPGHTFFVRSAPRGSPVQPPPVAPFGADPGPGAAAPTWATDAESAPAARGGAWRDRVLPFLIGAALAALVVLTLALWLVFG